MDQTAAVFAEIALVTTTITTNSIGIQRWAAHQGAEIVWENGIGDARIVGWRRDDGERAIETNGDPVFDGEGFDELWNNNSYDE